ncbi:MAG: hypothetical protein ACI9SI_000430 [Polaribacter sp.]|jgi:hypothetical protein
MEDDKNLVHQYGLKQKALKKENIKYIKRIPYYISGFVFFAIGLIYLLDGRVNHYVGNTFNLIVIIAAILGLTCLFYIIIIYIKTKKNNIEIRVLEIKTYNIMKL